MLDRDYGVVVSKIVDFSAAMNIAQRLILYASIDDMKHFLCWKHGLIRPLLVCRAVDTSLFLRGGCVGSGAIHCQFCEGHGTKKGGSFSGLIEQNSRRTPKIRPPNWL